MDENMLMFSLIHASLPSSNWCGSGPAACCRGPHGMATGSLGDLIGSQVPTADRAASSAAPNFLLGVAPFNFAELE